MRGAHFLLLPTFSDTFGYSAIEAMAHFTPVIGTTQGALPEFIEDGVNGLLLSLEKNEIGEWRHVSRLDRASSSYEALYESEVERLAAEAYRRI
jgi:glycosyltransferase involved in cell wall biosynthesis